MANFEAFRWNFSSNTNSENGIEECSNRDFCILLKIHTFDCCDANYSSLLSRNIFETKVMEVGESNQCKHNYTTTQKLFQTLLH